MHRLGHDSIIRGMLTHLLAIYGPRCEKTCLWGFANNTGADQLAHLRSLISTFVIRLLARTISKLTISEISFFWLVSVAEQAGLSLAMFGNPEDRFSRIAAHMILDMLTHLLGILGRQHDTGYDNKLLNGYLRHNSMILDLLTHLLGILGITA